MSNTDFLRDKPIAHRGLFNKNKGIPENSMLAFEKAIEKNYPIELDVHLLKDGNIVVFHDDNLSRMTGLDKKIKDCDLDEINKLKLDGTDYKIPIFKDVLKLVDGKVPILIEIKNDRKTGETEKPLLEILKNYKGNFAIQSFNPASVFWFKRNAPNILRGQLSASFKKDKMFILKKYFLSNLFFNFLTKPDFVSYALDNLPNKKVEDFRKSGKLVLCWTIRKDEDLKKSKDYCDNIIFESAELTDFE